MKKPIDFIVDTSVAPNRRPRYGFTIRNVSDVGLYVYLFFFDGTSFEIGTFVLHTMLLLTSIGNCLDAWYSSKMSPTNKIEQGCGKTCLPKDPCFPEDSSLPKDGLLTLGYGGRKMGPIHVYYTRRPRRGRLLLQVLCNHGASRSPQCLPVIPILGFEDISRRISCFPFV